MALLIGIILLIVVLCYGSIDKSVDRHYEKKKDNDKEFLKKWEMTCDEGLQMREAFDPGSKYYKETFDNMQQIFASFPHGMDYLQGEMSDRKSIPVWAYRAYAAAKGKLPDIVNDGGCSWRAFSGDEKRIEFVNAFYSWWLTELGKYGFPGKIFYRNRELKICVPYYERPNCNGGEYFFDYSGLSDDVLKKVYQRSI